MAIAWNGDFFENASSNKGIGREHITCAILTTTRQVWWRSDDGDGAWSRDAVLVGTVAGDSSLLFHTHYDGQYVWVENGIDHIWRSGEYGKDGSWEEYP